MDRLLKFISCRGVSCLEWKFLCCCAFGSGDERRCSEFLFFKQAGNASTTYIWARHLILKPLDIMLKMEMVLQILHHEKENLKSKEQCFPKQLSVSLDGEENKTGVESLPDRVEIPSDGTDVWEIDTSQLKVEHKVASGSYGDLQVLCQGTYCSQEVAIKVVEPERVSGDMLREFSQEAYIMRKIQHKNVVQFIGACTRPPNLCIVVKVADFGVARVQNQPGVMTAETGTYRWMAPEVGFERERCEDKSSGSFFSMLVKRRARTCTCNQTSSCSVCRAMRDCFLACTAQANTCNITRLWSAQNTLLAFQYLNHKAQESIIMVPNKIDVDYTTYNKVTTETCLNCDCCCIFCGGSSKAFVGGLFTSLSICQKRRTSLDESW
ncbi:hypothetical protein OIU76_024738 [Salix suchowensis]|nr:hypothetical protein OIU76_024738 [Salix suchowensis]